MGEAHVVGGLGWAKPIDWVQKVRSFVKNGLVCLQFNIQLDFRCKNSQCSIKLSVFGLGPKG